MCFVHIFILRKCLHMYFVHYVRNSPIISSKQLTFDHCLMKNQQISKNTKHEMSTNGSILVNRLLINKQTIWFSQFFAWNAVLHLFSSKMFRSKILNFKNKLIISQPSYTTNDAKKTNKKIEETTNYLIRSKKNNIIVEFLDNIKIFLRALVL